MSILCHPVLIEKNMLIYFNFSRASCPHACLEKAIRAWTCSHFVSNYTHFFSVIANDKVYNNNNTI